MNLIKYTSHKNNYKGGGRVGEVMKAILEFEFFLITTHFV